MSFAQKFEHTFKKLLPSPFSIALVLTAITFLLAFIFTKPTTAGSFAYAGNLADVWANGLWDGPLMVFAMQMMLILVLGHIIALSEPAKKLIKFSAKHITNTAQAAAIIAFFTMLVGFFNWGLGLVFGAIFARKMAESAKQRNLPLNYPLIGAAGYAGMMVWHGGLSGSAPVKANEAGHIAQIMQRAGGALNGGWPSEVPLEKTIFSGMNSFATLAILVLVPVVLFVVGKKTGAKPFALQTTTQNTAEESKPVGAEKIDATFWAATTFGILLVGYAIAQATWLNSATNFNFITPNYLNTLLLGLGLILHGSVQNFGRALNEAIPDAAGILIQFPLYFGVLALMRDTGLVQQTAQLFASISTAETFPVFTYISSGIINVFVPSGGGQWSIQAPILIETSQKLGVPLSKSIMAMAYGDQLTNMLQPFWALPLLGITGLKAKEILPYTLLLMLVGFLVFLAALLLF